MGRGFKQGGWNFDSLVRAVRHAGGGPYRLLGHAERVRVLEILACLPDTVEQPPEATGHYSFWHLPSRADCAWCVAEATAIAICDLLARRREEFAEDAA